MPSQMAAYCIYYENHCLPAMYTVVMVYGGTSMRMHSTSHLDYGLIVVYLNCTQEMGI